jgi:hypothetical protein
MSNLEALHRRAKALNLHGLLAHWQEAAAGRHMPRVAHARPVRIGKGAENLLEAENLLDSGSLI